MRFRSSPILVLSVILSGCQAPQMQQPMDVSAEVQAVNNQLAAAFAARDAAGVAALYTETGQVLPPNHTPVTGRAEIQALVESMYEMGLAGLELTTTEATAVDSLAVEVGRYRLMGAAGETLDEGKYLVWWQRTPEGWRLHRDIFNSNVAMP